MQRHDRPAAKRRARLAVSVAAATLVAGASGALAIRDSNPIARPTLEVASGPAARAHRKLHTGAISASMTVPWRALRGELGDRWVAQWDPATGVPNRLW